MTDTSTNSVIITAGGVGKRMGGTIPKQFHLLKGKPVIFHTIEKFYDFDSNIEVVLVLPADHVDFWNRLVEEHGFSIPVKVVHGGAERFHSVKNGLAVVSGDFIAVHDAVRPLVSEEVIADCFKLAEENGAVIPVVSVKESLRKVVTENSQAVDRSQYRIVQTPQVFKAALIQKAYEQKFSGQFTDDASVVEASGEKIYLVDGNPENIKITFPQDLKLAEVLLA